MIKNFSIFKTKEKKTPNSPDYSISAKLNDKFITIGAGWIKEMKDGSKYISCKFSEGYKDMPSFSITKDEKEPMAIGSDILEKDIPFM